MYVYSMEGIVYISIYYTFKGFFVYIYEVEVNNVGFA